jgi:hypothetical protein
MLVAELEFKLQLALQREKKNEIRGAKRKRVNPKGRISLIHHKSLDGFLRANFQS